GGPPAGPTSPCPESLMREPSSTPAGTLIRTLRLVRTRPSPAHSVQGLGMVVPNPPQAAHAVVVITWPRKERAIRCTEPWPWQTSQVTGLVPGWQQVP